MNRRYIDFINMVYLRGPNVWAYRPVVEALVDIGELEDCPSNTLPGFYERLSAWLPTLIEHRCSIGERGGFLQRLRQGTWPAHIMEHVALELQALAGMPGGLGRARETPLRGVYKVIIRAWHEPLARAALYAARDLVMAAIEDRPYEVDAAVDDLRRVADGLNLGPSTASIVDAADDRDIPFIRLGGANLLQLGYGARQRRIWTAETSRTSAIAEGISRNKDLTRQLLGACGVPVPEGCIVATPEEAWDAAQDIGLPVVIKPTDGNHGRGVFTGLASRAEIEAAFAVAVDEGSGVIVEQFIAGEEHRLLVVGGRVIAAARGEVAQVVGDGRSTVRELIDSQINSDPRRGSDEDHPLNPIRLDSAARMELARQGLDGDAVPQAGRPVVIQRSGNVSHDVTDRVHSEVARVASLAARVVGLDIAGIDLVARDIGQPLAEQGGAIVEVNAGPGLLMHLKPASGTPRPVGRAIVDDLFPGSDDGRIPVIGVTGSTGKTAVAGLVAHLLQLGGASVGLACSDGLYLGRRQAESRDCAHWEAGRRVLLNPAVEVAVIENGARTILGEGLAYDRCRIGIVTGIDPLRTWPEFHMTEPEQLRQVYRTQVDVILPTGTAVLNADDPAALGLGPLCDGAVILYGMRPPAGAARAHLDEGGRAVLLRGSRITLVENGVEIPVLDTDGLAAPPWVGDGWPAVALAAVAAVWALDMDVDRMRTGIQTWVDLQAQAVSAPAGPWVAARP